MYALLFFTPVLSASMSLDLTESPLVLMTHADLQQMLTGVVVEALAQRQAVLDGECRLCTAETATELSCQPHHLQALHKRGLAYVKGRPNYYRLSDLRAYRAARQPSAVPVAPLPHP